MTFEDLYSMTYCTGNDDDECILYTLYICKFSGSLFSSVCRRKNDCVAKQNKKGSLISVANELPQRAFSSKDGEQAINNTSAKLL
jgi:hypothetical protein